MAGAATASDENRASLNAETLHLVAESVREIGILVFVFGPLDEWLRFREAQGAGDPAHSVAGPDWVWIVGLLILGVALVAGGIAIQRVVSSYAGNET